MQSMNEDYVPYGPEWEKEMIKLRKKDLVDMVRQACLEKADWRKMMKPCPVHRANKNLVACVMNKGCETLPCYILEA